MIFLLPLALQSWGANVQPPERAAYEEALLAARNGQAAEWVPAFQNWAQQFPEQRGYLYDALQVQAWAGQHDKVVAQWSALDRADTPSWVLRAIGFSARSVQQTDLAMQVYGRAVQRDPHDWEAQAGLILTDVAATRLAPAQARLTSLRPALRLLSPAAALPVFRAALVLADAQRDDFAVLDASEHVLDALPDNAGALRARARALTALGAPNRAQQLPVADDTAAERADLAQRASARRLRWAISVMDTTSGAQRFAELNRWLDDAAPLIASAGVPGTLCASPAHWAALADTLEALVEAGRVQDAVQVHTAMQAADCQLPPYAEAQAAAAYAATRQPATAERLYRNAIAHEQAAGRQVPQGWWFGLYYALSDQQRHDEALTGLRTLLHDPVCGISPGRGAALPANPDRLSCRILLARLLLNANQINTAEAELRPLRTSAPADGALRLTWASLLQARERPQEAHRELVALTTDEPLALNARAALAASAFARHDYAAANALANQLDGASPAQADVLALRRDLANWQHPQVTVSGSADQGNGTGSASGGHAVAIETRVYSAPIDTRWRVFAHAYAGLGAVPAGSVRRNRLGLGADLRTTDLDGQAELHQVSSGAHDPGLALNMAWRLSDRWRVAAAFDSNSNDLPYAAYLNNIQGRSTTVRLSQIWSESRRFDATVGHTAFTDGNGRSDASLGWTERWFSTPLWQLDATLSVDQSRNTRPDAPYYNPASDHTVALSLSNQWQTSRTAERTFTQRLVVDLGAYQQAGQGGAPLTGVRYEHVWQWGPAFDYRYGAGLQHRPYDGVSSTRAFGYFDLSWYP